MKKKNWFIMLAFVLMGTSFVACGDDDDDDDDDDNNTNPVAVNMAMELGGMTYDLDKGAIILYGGDATDGYQNDITLLSPSITLDVTGQVLDTVYGIGNTFYLECMTEDAMGMTDGTYTYDTLTMPKMTFMGGYHSLVYDYGNDLGGTFVDIISGTLTVAHEGTMLVLGFTGKDDIGQDVKMGYKGDLNVIDFSKKGSRTFKK